MKYALLILLFLTVSCKYNSDDTCLKSVEEKIVYNIINDNIIDFNSEINCFEWDHLMFTDSHFSAESIESNTGLEINGFRLMGFRSLFASDYYSYAIFVHENRIAGFVDISAGISSENLLDGLNNKDYTLIEREDTRFKIYKIDNQRVNGDKVYSIKFINQKDSIKYSR